VSGAATTLGGWCGTAAKSGIGPELGRPSLGFGLLNQPPAADFLGLEVAAADLTLNGVACRVSLGGNVGGGEHGITVTRLRAAAQLGYGCTMQSNRTDAPIDHAQCAPESHDRNPGTDEIRPYSEPYDEHGMLSDKQSVGEDGLLACNDCGLPIFYCRADEWYHHVDPDAECFLCAAWGPDGEAK